MENIAVFGGTFNPIHIGHIEILSELNGLSYIDKIIIMPAKIPPHKNVDFLADSRYRFDMCKVAANMFSKATVSALELSREGKSYTVDTINELKILYPNSKIYFIVGGDMLCSFDTWKNYEEIIKKASIICFNRVGCNLDNLSSSALKLKEKGAEVIILDKEITDVSSTFLRQNIKNQEVLKDYIPIEILEFINKNSVYGG